MVLRGDAPLRGEEPEARETLLRVLRHEGVRVVTGAREIGARNVPGGTELTLERRQRDRRGAAHRHRARAPRRRDRSGRGAASPSRTAGHASTRTSRRRQAASGLSETRSAAITVASSSRTSRRYEGPQVAENALSGAHHEPAYATMPRVTFTDPEVAAVGLTEAEARERGIEVHTLRQARARARQGARDRRDGGLRQGGDRPRERQARGSDDHGRPRRRHAGRA